MVGGISVLLYLCAPTSAALTGNVFRSLGTRALPIFCTKEQLRPPRMGPLSPHGQCRAGMSAARVKRDGRWRGLEQQHRCGGRAQTPKKVARQRVQYVPWRWGSTDTPQR